MAFRKKPKKSVQVSFRMDAEAVARVAEIADKVEFTDRAEIFRGMCELGLTEYERTGFYRTHDKRRSVITIADEGRDFYVECTTTLPPREFLEKLAATYQSYSQPMLKNPQATTMGELVLIIDGGGEGASDSKGAGPGGDGQANLDTNEEPPRAE